MDLVSRPDKSYVSLSFLRSPESVGEVTAKTLGLLLAD